LATTLVLSGVVALPAVSQTSPEKEPIAKHPAAIWADPGDIGAKNLFAGPGGEKHRPQLPVKFLK
jgi:hypothetical protein